MAVLTGLIAAAGAIGAAKVASSGTKAAAQATTQAADQSAQVIRENYGQSAAALAPWQSQGLQANSMINNALGLTSSQPAQAYQSQPYQQQPQTYNALMPANDTGYQPYPGYIYGGRGGMTEDYSYLAPNAMGDMSSNGGGWAGAMGGQSYAQQPMQQGQMGGTVNTANPQSALDTYLNSTGYKFQFDQGMNALNSSFAGNGLVKSGAAAKGALKFGQGIAQQGFGNWLGAVGNQQDIGFRAASAQAGVSQGVGNSLANIYTNQGQNMAAIAAANGNNNAQLVNSLATIGAGIFGKKAGGIDNAGGL